MAPTKIISRTLMTSKPPRRPQGVAGDSPPQKTSVLFLPTWNTNDIVVWAKRNFADRDAKILCEHAEEVLACVLQRKDISSLLAKSPASFSPGFSHRLFKSRSDKLWSQYDQAVALCDQPSGYLSERVARSDQRFQYLTDPVKMEAALNKFRPLPNLLYFSIPKGYKAESHFFISKQRLALWKQYYNAVENGTDIRMVPSGPHGIGKSGIGLMVASTAYFLKKPVFYYPESRNFLTRDRALSTFIFWNYDLLATTPSLHIALDNLLALTNDDLSAFWYAFCSVPGAVVIFDEHNEFYRIPQYQAGVYEFYTSFQHFHAAQLVMFIGSAHSKFENNIPDGYQQSLLYLQPLDKEELKHFINEENSPIALDWSKIPGATAEHKFNTLFANFGGVYRLILRINNELNTSSYTDILASVQKSYYDRLLQTLQSLKNETRDTFIRFLKVIQTSGVEDAGVAKTEPIATVYDRGLLYVTSNGDITPVNGIAREAIMFMSFNESDPVLGGTTTSEQGARLEQAFISSLPLSKRFSGYWLYPAKKESGKAASQNRIALNSAHQHQIIVATKEHIPANLTWDVSKINSPVLLLPSSESHPSWDVIIKAPERVYFFQVTMAESDSELRVKLAKFKAFLGDSLEKPTLMQYAKCLYGDAAVVKKTDSHYTIEVTKSKKTVSIAVHFMLVHGVLQKISKEVLAKVLPGDDAWRYLEILPKEVLIEAFGIKF